MEFCSFQNTFMRVDVFVFMLASVRQLDILDKETNIAGT